LSAATPSTHTALNYGDADVNLDVNSFFVQSHAGTCDPLQNCEINKKVAGNCDGAANSDLS